jgi:hypothetical protein
LVPILNAHILKTMIPHSELKVFNCGHLFLLTRAAVEVKGAGRYLVTTDNTIEIEGESKPAVTASALAMLIG